VRVLLIDVHCKNSSTGKIVYDLYTALNNDGHIASICYGRGPLIDEPNIYKFSSDFETYVHAFLTRVTGFTGVFSPFSTRRLIKYIEKFKPDVVHIHELHAYFVNIAPVMRYLKEHNIKTIWTFHCEFMYTGKCGYAYDCEKWRRECGKCPQVGEYPASLFFDFTKRMYYIKKELFSGFDNLTIVTPSKWLAERVKQSFIKDKRIVVIHNGIDTEKVFYPREFKHLKEKHSITNEKIVLAVAPDVMSERKGGKLVLELARRMKNENIKFILIGANEVNEKFDENVIVLERTRNQIELAEYYSMADVFVICSKKENFPTTCLEAVSCGTPVCGFDEGGTKETVPSEVGEFVKYGDLEGLKNAVLSLLKRKFDYGLFEHYRNEIICKEKMYLEYKRIYES